MKSSDGVARTSSLCVSVDEVVLCAETAVASSRAAKICMRAMTRSANQKILTLVLISKVFK